MCGRKNEDGSVPKSRGKERMRRKGHPLNQASIIELLDVGQLYRGRALARTIS